MSYDRFESNSLVGQVFKAAERDDGRMEAIIEREKVPVSLKNKAGQTLAHIAAKFGNVRALGYLIEKDSDLLYETDLYHCTVLHLATIQGSLEAVRYLVEVHDADPRVMSGRYRDRTAVHAAVEFNRLEILKYYVERRGIDFNKPNPNQTIPPLFLAVRNRNWDVIEYLVGEKNANVRLLKSNEENILFIIVREDFLNLMKYLLDEIKVGLNVDWSNRHGETPVHVAAILDRIEILEYLVEEKNANVNAQKKTDKRTPLHYAASRDHHRACRFLVAHGADASLTDSYGDIAADKARDSRLIEFLENAAKNADLKRNPRSLDSAVHRSELRSPSSFEFTPQKSIDFLSGPVGRVDGVESSSADVASVSYFHNFLFLAQSITRIVSKKRNFESSRENRSLFISPSSVIRSRMSSIAIEAVDAETSFQKF